MKIRVKSTDLMQLTTIWLTREYEVPGFEIKEDDTIIDIGGILDCLCYSVNSFAIKEKFIVLSQRWIIIEFF